MRTSTLTVAVAGAMLCTLLAGCTGPVPQPTPTPEPTYAVMGDGVLRIGTLFPSSGAEAAYSSAQVAAVEAAIREVNEAGGYGGAPVEVLHRNAGDSEGSLAPAALDDLIARGVDVVIGPSSPGLAETLAPAAAAAGVALYSTAPAPDGAKKTDFVVHVTPPASAQADSLLAGIASSGAASVAVLHSTGDDTGDALVAQLTAAAESAGLTIAYDGALGTSSSSRSTTITALKKAAVDAVIVATSSEDPDVTPALVRALAAARIPATALWFAESAVSDYSALLPDVELAGAHGVVAGSRPTEAFLTRLRQADPAVGDPRFAAEAYDAVIVAILSATVAKDDGGAAIARNAPAVTAGGIPCASLGACLSVLATEPAIDYEGLSGALAISASGAATRGTLVEVEYGESNTVAVPQTVPAG